MQEVQTGTLLSPLGAARSTLPGCSPRRTSFPGNGARSSRGFSASCLLAACERTCTAPPVCTAGTQRHTTIRLLKGHSAVAQTHSHRAQQPGQAHDEMEKDKYGPSSPLQVMTNKTALLCVFNDASYSQSVSQDRNKISLNLVWYYRSTDLLFSGLIPIPINQEDQ